jgi:enediyne biosynthesis protein E4
MRLFLALPLLAAPAAADPAVPRFIAEPEAGVATAYQGDWEYMVGGGVAAFDCGGDGFPDLLIPGGAEPARLYRNVSAPGGAIRFEPADSGLEVAGVTGAYPLDIDGDGIADLVLLRQGENLAMRGLGGCRFERANEAWGFDGGDGWSTALAATWEAAADWPTIAVGNYIDPAEPMPWGACTDNWLHRPSPGGGFAAPEPLVPSFCALSMLFTDWDRSGTPALRISNDREYYRGGEEQLWGLPPGAPPSPYTEADGWRSLRIWGMGIASHDLTGDGRPEYFLTSMADNKLQALAPGFEGPAYDDIAFARGVTAHRPHTGDDLRPSTAWHAEFGDVNNDGRADLFVAKGNVAEMPDFAIADPNNLLLQRADGTFAEAGDKAGIASTRTARGGALVDLNLDGRLDLVVVNRWEPPEIWRNDGTDGEPAGRWLALRLTQHAPNRTAIGARIEVRAGNRTLSREAIVGGGHAGGQLGFIHVGLGEAEAADVRVIWPDGAAGDWQRLEADAFYHLARGAPARRWSPRTGGRTRPRASGR